MARLVNLEIENFRGIRAGKLTDMAEVNVLIGRNNSGKSSILEAICRSGFAVGQQLDTFGRFIHHRWNNIRNAKNEHDYLYRRNIEIKSMISTLIQYDEGRLGYLSIQLPSMTVYHQDSEQARVLWVDFLRSMILFRPNDGIDTIIESNCWPKLLADRRDKLILKTINSIFNIEAEGLQLLPSGEFMVMFDEYSIPLDSMGDGTRAAMRALMCLAMVEKTLFLMEEPECHQHPAALEALARGMCAIAKKRGIQILLTTHSMECIRAFRKATLESESTFAVHHLSLNDGIQTARRLSGDALDSLDDGGIDVRYADLYV